MLATAHQEKRFSVQSTDKKVNETVPPLYKIAPDAATMALLDVSPQTISPTFTGWDQRKLDTCCTNLTAVLLRVAGVLLQADAMACRLVL